METFFSKQLHFTNMILLVYSNQDTAGTNIARCILKRQVFTASNQTCHSRTVYTTNINQQLVTLVAITDEAVNAQNLPESFPNSSLIIFLSRHSSQSGKPTLSVHTPGNFAEAKLGGLADTLSVSPANAMHIALKALNQQKQQRNLCYEVSYECTHHGPSLNVPTMFVELGSTPTQWRDLHASDAVAQAVLEMIGSLNESSVPAVVGIGGPHYNQKFTKMALNNEAAFGHIVPKHAVSLLNIELLSQCIQKTAEKTSCVILDWKGIKSQDKPGLLSLLKETDLFVKKV
ncbi:MAG: hypothetical protein N3D85_06075 [Candidatus Bathyarchaeota archaeon]|nr:hypothetical protein [Candidatus Bathyarchaeota archaeon]